MFAISPHEARSHRKGGRNAESLQDKDFFGAGSDRFIQCVEQPASKLQFCFALQLCSTYRHITLNTNFPEVGSQKFLPQNHAATDIDDCGSTKSAAGSVIQRKKHTQGVIRVDTPQIINGGTIDEESVEQ